MDRLSKLPYQVFLPNNQYYLFTDQTDWLYGVAATRGQDWEFVGGKVLFRDQHKAALFALLFT